MFTKLIKNKQLLKLALLIFIGIIGSVLLRSFLVANDWGKERSILVAGICGVFYFIFVYYLAYQYFFQNFKKRRISSKINNMILNFLAGFAATFWFPMTNTHTQFLIDWANNTFKESAISFFPLVSNKWYYHYFFQISLGLAFGVAFFLVSQILNKFLETKKGLSLARINSAFFYFLVFLYLSGVFATGFQHETPIEKSTWFFGGTEEMITDRLTDNTSFREDIQQNGGFDYYYLYQTTGDKFIYKSATGFYGSVFKLIQTTLHIDAKLFIKVYRVICALLVALTFSLLVYKTRKMFGVLAAFIAAILISLIWWIVGPAKHLYWIEYIYYLPFILPWLVYPGVYKGKLTIKNFYILIFILEFLMMLKGYTYVSNIILAPTVGVLFYELRNKSGIKQLIIRVFLTGVCGFAAFIFVFGLHFIQLSIFEQSPEKALDFILDRAETRISGSELQQNYVSGSYAEVFAIWIREVRVFVKPLSDSLQFNVFGRLINLNNFLSMHILFFFILITSSFSFFLKWIKSIKTKKITIGNDKIFSLSLACGWAMICSWSWFAAKNHMANHDHMNGIMYFLPFGLTLIMLAGGFLETSVKKLFAQQN